MNIKNLITVATAMMFAAGLLIWSKAGETECIYAIDEKGIYYYKASKENEIRPVIYLNSHLTVSSGDGSENEPYVIK